MHTAQYLAQIASAITKANSLISQATHCNSQRKSTPAQPRTGIDAISPWAIASMVQARAAAAGFDGPHFGGHSLKRGALTTGMERGAHPADLKRLGRHKSFDVLGEYLEFGDMFDRHALKGVL